MAGDLANPDAVALAKVQPLQSGSSGDQAAASLEASVDQAQIAPALQSLRMVAAISGLASMTLNLDSRMPRTGLRS